MTMQSAEVPIGSIHKGAIGRHLHNKKTELHKMMCKDVSNIVIKCLVLNWVEKYETHAYKTRDLVAGTMIPQTLSLVLGSIPDCSRRVTASRSPASLVLISCFSSGVRWWVYIHYNIAIFVYVYTCINIFKATALKSNNYFTSSV